MIVETYKAYAEGACMRYSYSLLLSKRYEENDSNLNIPPHHRGYIWGG